MCTGVGVRRDVVGIEDFYTILSGKTVELSGFIDLSAMAAAAGYKFRARNMTALGVQVLGISKETEDESDRQVVYRSDSEQVNRSREELGSALATLELDSAMGVGSRIVPSKGTEDKSEDVYRQLKKLMDEPVDSGSKGEPSKPKSKIGMRTGMKKSSKSWVRDSRVYSYDELIEYRPKRDDSDDDSFRFNLEDKEMEF